MNISDGTGQSHYQITQTNGNTVKFGIVSGSDIELSGSSNNSMYFKTNNTERLRIASDGKIGIGEDDPDGNQLLIRAASTVGTTKGHIMLTGDGATNGEGPQIVFSESGSGSSYAGAYIGHVRTTTNSVGDLVFGTRATGGDANTIPTERLRITSTGFVGINTNNPARRLHVEDGNSELALFRSTKSTGSYVNFKLGANGAELGMIGSGAEILSGGADAGDFGVRSTGDIRISTGGHAEKMCILSDGKIGIGTIAPATSLHAYGGGTGFRLEREGSNPGYYQVAISHGTPSGANNYGSAYFTLSQTTGDYVWRSSTTERMRLLGDSGNLGIGDDNPGQKLSVKNAAACIVQSQSTNSNTSAIFQCVGKNSSGTSRTAKFCYDNADEVRIITDSAIPIKIMNSNAERFRITPTGTAVFGGNTSAPIVDNGELYYRGNSTQTFESLPQSFYLYGNSLGSNTANAGTGMVFGGNYNTSGAYTTFAGIHGIKENTTSGQYGGALVFGVRNDGGGAWERMRLKSNGDLSITDGNLKVASGHGIDFSSTADGSGGGMWGELLDDYEHGSFTPTTNGWSTVTPYGGSNYNSGWYVKIGDIVHVGWKIYYNTLSGSGNHIGIGGFPFSSAGNQTSIAAARFDVPETAVTYDLIFYMGSNATSVWLYRKNSSGSISAINSSGNRSNVWTMGQITYYSG